MKTKIAVIAIATLTLGYSGYAFIGTNATKCNEKVECKKTELADLSNSWTQNNNPIREPFNSNNLQIINMQYSVAKSNHFGQAITPAMLLKADKLSDVLKDYPSNWLSNYTSVTITTIVNNESVSIESKDETLTTEQKELLLNTEMPASFIVDIAYKSENAVTNQAYDNRLTMYGVMVPEITEQLVAITPAKEAEFKGGYESLINYLKENSAKQMANKSVAAIAFTINEEGKAQNLIMNISTENEALDNLLKEMILNMPAWTPAENENGKLTTQTFEFSVGIPRC